jgi:CheY-like chemotaxis protein
LKILVIDDDDLVLYTLSRILRGNGDTVITAKNGAQGLDAFRSERPDIVVTDIIMPEQEGLGTIVMIRRESADVKIIAISGGGRIANLDVLEAARALGADDVIAKPFEPETLLERLARLNPGSPTASRVRREDPG